MVTDTGWLRIGPDPGIAAWAAAALSPACAALAATNQPLRCGGTWAVGLELLDNDPSGAIAHHPFPWRALPMPQEALHRGQVSAIYPGYPQPMESETPAGFGFRIRRDAAHLDGLLAVGPQKRRMLVEPHSWILGIALTDCTAAPLVVWEGSHLVMHRALQAAFAPHPASDWGRVDLTNAYKAARAQVFETCRRVEVPIAPGEATLLHRMTLHGVAPWGAAVCDAPVGRIIAYFRPERASVQDWMVWP